MNFTPTILYLATILPPIILGLVIWRSDKFQEPGHLLAASFLLGASIGLPLHLFINIVEDILAPFFGIDVSLEDAWGKLSIEEKIKTAYPWLESAYQNFLRAAFLEEGIKFALLIFFCVRLADLNEPMDCLVYGAAIGLGYAAYENLGYLSACSAGAFGSDCLEWDMIKKRLYPMVMHLGFGTIMGLFLSLTLFNERSVFKKRLWIVLSLLVPVVYHGIYNYEQTFATFPLLTLLIVVGIFSYYRRGQHQRITEPIDKNKIENIEIFYSYVLTLTLVVIIIVSSTFIQSTIK